MLAAHVVCLLPGHFSTQHALALGIHAAQLTWGHCLSCCREQLHLNDLTRLQFAAIAAASDSLICFPSNFSKELCRAFCIAYQLPKVLSVAAVDSPHKTVCDGQALVGSVHTQAAAQVPSADRCPLRPPCQRQHIPWGLQAALWAQPCRPTGSGTTCPLRVSTRPSSSSMLSSITALDASRRARPAAHHSRWSIWTGSVMLAAEAARFTCGFCDIVSAAVQICCFQPGWVPFCSPHACTSAMP